MKSASVYEQTTIIHELTQGIEMAKQLRLNLNSAEARQFFIQNILSSYDKALFLLKSAGQPHASQLPESSLPKSSISTGSLQSGEFEFDFDHNVVSKKRKLSPPPPPSPEKHETKPTNHHHQLPSPNSDENLSNLRSNLSVNTWDLSAILPSSYSFPSTPFGFSDDDNLEQLLFPEHLDEELLQGYSPPFIPPATSESTYLTDWGSSSTLDFLTEVTEPVDLYPNFEFNNFFL